MDIVGGEGIGRGFTALVGQQADGVKGQGFGAPPMGIAAQGVVVSILDIGAGAHGEKLCLGAGSDDGDVQQRREGTAILGQLDGQRVDVLGLDGGHIRQPGGVAGGLLGAEEGVGHILGRQG